MTTLKKQTIGGSRTEAAFSRGDLSVVLATILLILGVVLPALASSKSRSQRAICANNLRMVGQGVLLFNMETFDLDPWRYAKYTPPGIAAANNIFFNCLLLSNGVTNPKVFACPSDPVVNPADNFGAGPGGIAHYLNRNLSISYFFGLDSSALIPDSVLSGDYNIRPNGGMSSGCSSGVTPVASVIPHSPTPSTWGTALHGPAGNILFRDGHVEWGSNEVLRRFFTTNGSDGGSFHLQLPRPPIY